MPSHESDWFGQFVPVLSFMCQPKETLTADYESPDFMIRPRASYILPTMSPELTAIIVVGLSNAAVIGFLWSLHRDVSDLRERMARLEGLFEGFTRSGREAPPPAR